MEKKRTKKLTAVKKSTKGNKAAKTASRLSVAKDSLGYTALSTVVDYLRAGNVSTDIVDKLISTLTRYSSKYSCESLYDCKRISQELNLELTNKSLYIPSKVIPGAYDGILFVLAVGYENNPRANTVCVNGVYYKFPVDNIPPEVTHKTFKFPMTQVHFRDGSLRALDNGRYVTYPVVSEPQHKHMLEAAESFVATLLSTLQDIH